MAAAAANSSRGRASAGIQKPGPRTGSEGTSRGPEGSGATMTLLLRRGLAGPVVAGSGIFFLVEVGAVVSRRQRNSLI